MGKWICMLLILVAVLPPLCAEEHPSVTYVGGSLLQVKEGSVGSLETADIRALQFVAPSGIVAIPYDRVEAFEHSSEVAVHLGVAPAVVVGLVKRRRRNHFLRITFKDQAGVSQLPVFEIPKTMPMVLIPLLVARASRARCGPALECGPAYLPASHARVVNGVASAATSTSVK